MPAVYSRVCRNLQSKSSNPSLISQFYPRLVFFDDFVPHFQRRKSYFGVAGYVTRKKLNAPEHSRNLPNGIFAPSVPARNRWILPCVVVLSSSVKCLKFMSTFTSHDGVTTNEGLLNQIISGVEGNHISDMEILTFVDKLCRYRSLPEISKLLSVLHDRNIYLGASAYELLLATTSRENDVELSLEIFKDMLVLSSPLRSGAYFNLARAFSTSDECTCLLKFVNQIPELMLPRSIRVFNRMIFAFGKVGQAQKALAIFERMERFKCSPDLCTYNTVVEILGHMGKVNGMLVQVAAMREGNIAPNIVTYNTLINNFRRLCRFDLCSLHWKDMEKSGILPDLRTYTAMIDSLGRSGNVEGSLTLFHQMKCKGIRPSIYIYRSLIDCSKTMGQPEMAASLHKEMIASMPNLVGPEDFNG